MTSPPRVRVPGRPQRDETNVADVDDAEVAAAAIFSDIIAKIKQSQPTRPGDGVTQGFVFSFLEVGMPISPYDMAYQWHPVGGARRDGSLSARDLNGAPGEVPVEAEEDLTPEQKRAYRAAFNVGQVFNEMLMVTADGTKTSYSVGRDLATQYSSVLAAMEAMPLPERDAADVARIEAARAVLFDADGYQTDAYIRYEDNTQAYQDAAADYAMASAEILADPARADMAPMLLRGEKAKVDRAYNKWRSDDTEKIEAALATVQSLGIPLEQGMIAKARRRFEAWTLPLIGIDDTQSYTNILPSEWADPDPRLDSVGWTTIEKKASDLTTYRSQHGTKMNSGSWRKNTKNADVNVDVNFLKILAKAKARTSKVSTSTSETSDSSSSNNRFNLSNERIASIKLQYMLCKIYRPWLDANLFRMDNYYLRGAKAGCISDGTIDGQVLKEDPLIPMLPTHILVVRNVESEFESDRSTRTSIEDKWNQEQKDSSDTTVQRSLGASGIWSWVGGSVKAKKDERRERSSFKTESGRNVENSTGAWARGDKFGIDGCQVICYLSEITPMCPPLSDPALSRKPSTPAPVGGPAGPTDGGGAPAEPAGEDPAGEPVGGGDVPAEPVGQDTAGEPVGGGGEVPAEPVDQDPVGEPVGGGGEVPVDPDDRTAADEPVGGGGEVPAEPVGQEPVGEPIGGGGEVPAEPVGQDPAGPPADPPKPGGPSGA